MNILAILIFGLVLRMISLNQSLWLDEATTSLVSNMSLSDIFTKFLPGDFHPPLYYLLMKICVLFFGGSEISLRIPSVIFGLGTIFLVYKIASHYFDDLTGKVAAFLTATSGLLIYYSQEARMYSLAAFLVALCFYLLSKRLYLLFGIFLMLLGANDYVSLLIVPVFWVISLKDRSKFYKSLLPLGVFFVFWSTTFLRQLGYGLDVAGTAWGRILGPSTLKNILLIPVKFVFGRIGFSDQLVYTLIVATTFVFIIAIFYRSKPARSSKIFWLWLILPTVLGIIVSLKIPTLSYFRFIFTLPSMYILIASALVNSGNIKKLGLVLMICLNIATSLTYLFNSRFQREDWRSAVKYIENLKSDKSITIFVSKSNWEAYRYYAPDAKIGSSESLNKDYDQIFLMRYVQDIFDPEDTVAKRVLELGYKYENTIDFNGVVAYRYTGQKQ